MGKEKERNAETSTREGKFAPTKLQTTNYRINI